MCEISKPSSTTLSTVVSMVPAMKPRKLKITNPAKIPVAKLVSVTIIVSLYKLFLNLL